MHETTKLLLITLPDIRRFKKISTHTLSNKPFLILTTQPHFKYVATLPCKLSLIACFADINVSQGSVATYARCGGMCCIRLTANLLRNLPVKNFLNRSRFDRITVMSLWPRFWPTLYTRPCTQTHTPMPHSWRRRWVLDASTRHGCDASNHDYSLSAAAAVTTHTHSKMRTDRQTRTYACDSTLVSFVCQLTAPPSVHWRDKLATGNSQYLIYQTIVGERDAAWSVAWSSVIILPSYENSVQQTFS